MIEDVVYKVLRKSLPQSLYTSLSKSPFGREKGWKRIETYASTFAYYQNRPLAFAARTVVEVGSGDQFYTALFFLDAGARQVLLVEPKMIFDPGKLAADLERFNGFAGKRLRLEDVREKITCFSDLSEIPSGHDGRLDLMCSYLVLEHFREIETFFLHTGRLLAPGGISCNRVDLSDHTYHLFGKYRMIQSLLGNRSLYHLRYSDRMFARLNDPKCFMNRRLLPEYLALAEKHGLRVARLSKVTDEQARVHPDLMGRHPAADAADLKVVNFLLMLEKQAGA